MAAARATRARSPGAPILTVPLELAHGLPVAVSLWGARGSEPTLLQLGQALEAGRDTSDRAAAGADVRGMGVISRGYAGHG